jgi:GTP-binding protein
MLFDETPMVLIDTAGVRRRGRIDRGLEKYSVLRTVKAVQRSNVCLLVIDGSEPITAQDTHLAGQILDSGKGVVIVFNKCDLIKQEMYQRELLNNARIRLKFIPYAPVCFTSALMEEGIRGVVQRALMVYKEGSKMVSQDDLRKTLMSALAAHPPSGRKGRSLRIYGISQKEARPPTFVIPVNNPTLVHFSYERFLENRLRSIFKFEGNPLNLLFQRRTSR